MNTAKHCQLLIAAAGMVLAASPSKAALAYGLTATGLVQFDTAAPAFITNTATFSGLTAGDTIADIDFRPQDRKLYGIAPSGRLYTIDPLTGVALVNTSGAMGTVQRMDFNPVANRLRVLSAGDQNYRITPGTGLLSTDGVFSFAAGDANFGANPNLMSAAYTNNFAGAAGTTLFSVDSDLDILISHSVGPQFSTLNTIGSLGINLGSDVGFDIIDSDNKAFLTNGQDLYGVNLLNGSLTPMGIIGGSGIRGLAVVPEPSAAAMALLGTLAAAGRRNRRAV